MDSQHTSTDAAGARPAWQPVSAVQRRVLGVLAEKAKTTPDAYPMTVNAIVNGSNQKNNRAPLMQLEEADVSDALDRLRQLGAVRLVVGSGRSEKHRHALYEWLGVDKVELAVMAELLLRGPQTEGELRGRAARMEPISDVAALRPVLASLKSKGLLVSLSQGGRGHVVTHALYEPREMERIRAGHASDSSSDELGRDREHGSGSRQESVGAAVATHGAPASRMEAPAIDELGRRELIALRDEVRQLRADIETLSARVDASRVDIDLVKQSLGI